MTRHIIHALPGSDEFRAQFRVIRDAFIAKLHECVVEHNVSEFKACNVDRRQIAWVWDKEKFRFVGKVGGPADARAFAINMIDSGMHFAFCATRTPNGIVIWLSTWEAPDEGPKWPRAVKPIFEEIHEGVEA